MRVVTGEMMQCLDRRAIEEFGVSGLTLMENAGRGCVAVITSEHGIGPGRRAVVVAGKGNNGGDGYVIARLLKENGWQVVTFVLAPREEIGGDARANLERLSDLPVLFCPEQGELGRYGAALREATLIVDALLGTGLR